MYIEKLDDGSVLLTAPVMVPGVPDCDYPRGEPPLTKDQVDFFAKSHEKYQFVDDEHMLTRGGQRIGDPQKSFILESDKSYELFDGTTETYPAGTWMLTSHLTEEKAIRKALNDEYSGYSPTVRSRDVADAFLEDYQSALKSQDDGDIALKSFSSSGLIRDVPDPVVLSVSLTKKPCQTHSKFCKLKNNGENMENDSKTLDKIRKLLNGSGDSDVEALKSQMDGFDEKLEEIKNDNAEALKSMKEEIISDFTAVLSEAFADKKQKPKGPEDPEDPEGNEEDNGSDEDSNEENSNSEEEEDDELKKSKQKTKNDGSKQGKNHNANQNADKSQTVDTYTFLGRNPDGTAKRN